MLLSFKYQHNYVISQYLLTSKSDSIFSTEVICQ